MPTEKKTSTPSLYDEKKSWPWITRQKKSGRHCCVSRQTQLPPFSGCFQPHPFSSKNRLCVLRQAPGRCCQPAQGRSFPPQSSHPPLPPPTLSHRTALHCTARHGTAWHGTARHHTAPHFTTLRYSTPPHCAAMRCTGPHPRTASHRTASHRSAPGESNDFYFCNAGSARVRDIRQGGR